MASNRRNRIDASSAPPPAPVLEAGFPVAQAGRVYPLARIPRPMDDQHGQRLLRGVSVPARHLALGRRARLPEPSAAARAVLQGVARLEAGRRKLARVGHGESVRGVNE